MKISNNINAQNNSNKINKTHNQAFGQKFLYGDIMTIMSDVFTLNTESTDKVVTKILGKPINNLQDNLDYMYARNILHNNFPELRVLAKNFREALNINSKNFFDISPEAFDKVVEVETKKIGSKYLDIDI